MEFRPLISCSMTILFGNSTLPTLHISSNYGSRISQVFLRRERGAREASHRAPSSVIRFPERSRRRRVMHPPPASDCSTGRSRRGSSAAERSEERSLKGSGIWTRHSYGVSCETFILFAWRIPVTIWGVPRENIIYPIHFVYESENSFAVLARKKCTCDLLCLPWTGL